MELATGGCTMDFDRRIASQAAAPIPAHRPVRASGGVMYDLFGRARTGSDHGALDAQQASLRPPFSQVATPCRPWAHSPQNFEPPHMSPASAHLDVGGVEHQAPATREFARQRALPEPCSWHDTDLPDSSDLFSESSLLTPRYEGHVTGEESGHDGIAVWRETQSLADCLGAGIPPQPPGQAEAAFHCQMSGPHSASSSGGPSRSMPQHMRDFTIPLAVDGPIALARHRKEQAGHKEPLAHIHHAPLGHSASSSALTCEPSSTCLSAWSSATSEMNAPLSQHRGGFEHERRCAPATSSSSSCVAGCHGEIFRHHQQQEVPEVNACPPEPLNRLQWLQSEGDAVQDWLNRSGTAWDVLERKTEELQRRQDFEQRQLELRAQELRHERHIEESRQWDNVAVKESHQALEAHAQSLAEALSKAEARLQEEAALAAQPRSNCFTAPAPSLPLPSHGGERLDVSRNAQHSLEEVHQQTMNEYAQQRRELESQRAAAQDLRRSRDEWEERCSALLQQRNRVQADARKEIEDRRQSRVAWSLAMKVKQGNRSSPDAQLDRLVSTSMHQDSRLPGAPIGHATAEQPMEQQKAAARPRVTVDLTEEQPIRERHFSSSEEQPIRERHFSSSEAQNAGMLTRKRSSGSTVVSDKRSSGGTFVSEEWQDDHSSSSGAISVAMDLTETRSSGGARPVVDLWDLAAKGA